VGGKGAGDRGRGVGEDKGTVVFVRAGFDSGVSAGRPETFWGGDAAVNVGHGAMPPALKPSDSSRPHMRFMHWTAMPAVPPQRLSMALTMMRLPVRGSLTQPMSQKLVPRTGAISGVRPSGRIRIKGSSA